MRMLNGELTATPGAFYRILMGVWTYTWEGTWRHAGFHDDGGLFTAVEVDHLMDGWDQRGFRILDKVEIVPADPPYSPADRMAIQRRGDF